MSYQHIKTKLTVIGVEILKKTNSELPTSELSSRGHFWCRQFRINTCKVNLFAVVRFSFMFFFQMSSHIAFLNMNICKLTLIACLFPNVSFHRSSQIGCLSRWNATLIACVQFSKILDYTCPLKSAASTDAKSQ